MPDETPNQFSSAAQALINFGNAKSKSLTVTLDLARVWAQTSTSLRLKLGDASFDTWIKPLSAGQEAEGTVILEAPDSFFRAWVSEHYKTLIEEMLCQCAQQPLAVQLKERVPRAALNTRGRAKSKSSSVSLRSVMEPRILTVDDVKASRLLVKAALLPFACTVLEATNGVEGLELAKQKLPDLILLDNEMPVMNGKEMLARLKADPELRRIPIIMLTAEATRANVLSIVKLGVRAYLVKPFTTEALLERIRQFIDLGTRNSVAPQIVPSDAPLQILVVDNQPAILERVKAGLAGTAWTMHGARDASEAMAACDRTLPSIILISLSLPENSGLTLSQRFRADPRTKDTPMLALSVQTTAEEQARAKEWGFSGMVTKPVDSGDLQLKIARALSLDASLRYFQRRDGLLVLLLPANFNQLAHDVISTHLREKVHEAVNAGLDGLVLELSQLKVMNTKLMRLGQQVTELCAELRLPCALAIPEALYLECRNHPETEDWWFSSSFEQAAAALRGTTPA